jgi:hypothetical protein
MSIRNGSGTISIYPSVTVKGLLELRSCKETKVANFHIKLIERCEMGTCCFLIHCLCSLWIKKRRFRSNNQYQCTKFALKFAHILDLF